MDLTLGLVSLVVTFGFILLSGLTILRLGMGRLEDRIGIDNDGPPLGHIAPTWQLADTHGRMHQSPSGSRWQLLAFVDHSLASFPEVRHALNTLPQHYPDLDVFILARRWVDQPTEELALVEAIHVPVVLVNQQFYDDFRVRVMPFAVLLSPDGTTYWSGLVNHEAPLKREIRLAQAQAQH